jgi:hypothetical protein
LTAFFPLDFSKFSLPYTISDLEKGRDLIKFGVLIEREESFLNNPPKMEI